MNGQSRVTSDTHEGGALTGKIAIITGSSKGIGRAIALRLAEEKVKVVLAARDAAALAAVVGEIEARGGTATVFEADLRVLEAPAALVKTALQTYGALNIVVNCAGATRRGEFLELSDTDWMDGFALKFFGAVRLLRTAWPYLKASKGSVLNIVGVGGRTPGAEFTIGGSVNGACLSFTKALANLGIRDGVQVNAINPGWIRTDRLRRTLELAAVQHGSSIAAETEQLIKASNMTRLGEPEDVADLAAFILSPRARLLQGALVDIDGGMTKTI